MVYKVATKITAAQSTELSNDTSSSRDANEKSQ
jgi:hypothetical protein